MKRLLNKTKLLPFFALSTQVFGQTFLIDFGLSSQETSSTDDALSREWNNVSLSSIGTANPFTASGITPLAGDLIDTDGNSTAVDLFYTSIVNGDAAGIGGSDNNVATSLDLPQSATRDAMFMNDPGGTGDQTLTFEIRNLDSTKLYDLSFFGSVPGTFDRPDNIFTVGAISDRYSPVNNIADVASLSGVATDINRTITILWTVDPTTASHPNHIGHLSTLQITTIPEPSTYYWALSISALLVFAKMRRKRK